MIETVRWSQKNSYGLLPGKLKIIDQTRLPEDLIFLETDSIEDVYNYIKNLTVRGAPAIGCAASLGLAAACQKLSSKSRDEFIVEAEGYANFLAKSRPTAVNLFWALEKSIAMLKTSTETNVQKLKELMVLEGLRILNQDIEMCKSIGKHGAVLLKDGDTVLTHCNAGALATGDYGTALSPVYVATENGLKISVYSDETRPLLQGSRLTAWELKRAGIDVTTICDNMAAQVMSEGKINIVITGADRIAANGDAANKIGTYGVAILAKYHNIPFYIAAPHSTIDTKIKNGTHIPIEKRDQDEVRRGFGKLTAPADVNVYNPAFDVTPNELISGIITEGGILKPPYTDSIRNFMKNKIS